VADSGLPGVIVEGRDITTVVAPDAPVRILLTAAPDVRAARRSAELTTQDAAAVAAALHKRDASDSQVVDFLTAAPGVTVVDSTDMDFAQTVDAVLDVIRSGTGGSR
jgi:cytidylate kinase